jgi:SNF2-related domain
MTSWIETPRVYNLEPKSSSGSYLRKLYLTPENRRHEGSPRIKVPLLEHQKITLAAMIEVENIQSCKINGPLLIDPRDSDDSQNFCDPAVETRAAVLSEKPGSGKTYEILSLIACNPTPAKRPEISTLSLMKTSVSRYDDECGFINRGFAMEVRRTYKKINHQTLIFVGKSVLEQWMGVIKNHTNFKVYLIDGIRALRQYHYDYFRNGKKGRDKLKVYDIILVKNSGISGEFEVDELKGTPLHGVKCKSILSVFGELFKNICWARVVLDDFDMLSIPSSAKCIPALFTWLVSATKHLARSSKRARLPETSQQLLLNYRPSYYSIWENRLLFTFFNIGCDEEFINESTNATLVNYWFYQYRNPADKYIELIGALGTTDARELVEMLNGDAVNTAAERVGIKGKSVADILQKMLDKNWEEYYRAAKLEKHQNEVAAALSALPEHEPSGENHRLSKEEYRQFLVVIGKSTPYKRFIESLGARYSELVDVLAEAQRESRAKKEQYGKIIQRVKDNLRGGECPITAQPLNEAIGLVIVKCCGIVVSNEAINIILRVAPGSQIASGTCPNCRAVLLLTSLIYVDREEIQIDDIVDEKGVFDKSHSAPMPSTASELATMGEKYLCVVRIIRGEQIAERQSGERYRIRGLLEGVRDAGTADAESGRKVIIFASFNETMDNIQQALESEGIAYMKIQGSLSQIHEAVGRYSLPADDPESINVLLITGPGYCAGLNLQMTTDLIFAHRVGCEEVERQVAGRAARIGRQSNLNIHYIFYNNEVIRDN